MQFNIQVSKKLTPKFQAGSPQPKVLIARNWHVTELFWLAQVIPHTFKPSMPDEKEYFRLSFPVYSNFHISLPVWADIIKRSETKF